MVKIDRHALLELEVLKQVEGSPLLTNRKLADKLGVSVKLSHALLSQMVERGLFHIKKHHSRRWDYFLTPEGLAEKARLTYEFIKFSMQFYHEARKRSARICREIAESGRKKIAFLGTGELAEIAYLGVKEWKLDLVEVFSEDKASEYFFGIPVRNIKEISSSRAEFTIVCLFDKNKPMSEKYLPPNIGRTSNMHWIF